MNQHMSNLLLVFVSVGELSLSIGAESSDRHTPHWMVGDGTAGMGSWDGTARMSHFQHSLLIRRLFYEMPGCCWEALSGSWQSRNECLVALVGRIAVVL